LTVAVSLQQLRYFVVVAEERQITAAARRLHMAQPALSQAIHALERDLGVDLLDRGRQGVTPTAAGRRFAQMAARAVAAVDEAVADVRREGHPRLVIGVEPGAPLDDLVTGFHAAFPEIEVIVRVVTFATELSAIRDGDVDVGFLFPPYREPTVTLEPLVSIPAVVHCGWETSLARERTVRFEQIAEAAMPARHPDVPIEFADLFHLTAARGRPPPTVEEAPTTVEETVALLATGRAIAVSPAGVRFPTPSPVATVPLVDVPPFVLSLAYRTDERSPAVAAFLHYVRAFQGAAWVHVHATA
jgi:DNA-binding transcriptional LysR family regulator